MQSTINQEAIQRFRGGELSENEISGLLKQVCFTDDGKKLTAKEVASMFYMSNRTFNRRLQEKDVSFYEITKELLKERAIYYLACSDLNISEISRRLGYSESANFCKAFKRWTGMPPKEYSEQAKNPGYLSCRYMAGVCYL